MNKRSIYILLLTIFLALSAFVVIRYNVNLGKKQVTYYPLLERQGALAALPEWPDIKSKGEKLFRKIVIQPDDIPTAIALAGLFIQEARITGNYNYYNTASSKYIDDVLAIQPQNFEALVLKAIIQLSEHHFSDALETAEAAQKINPYNAFIYGIMVDANVELGNYEKAVENSDQMMSIRPDIRSYSRVSYLREIHGDLPGAIEAMKMAVGAGGYGEESTSWARVQLARLYEMTGDLKSAEMHYLITLDQRPEYAAAVVGLGHLALADSNYNKAIRQYQHADSIVNDFSIKEQLAEVYQLSGDPKKADAIATSVVKDLTGEQSVNHHADKELAYLYLLKNNPSKALEHAKTEYSRRPDNIDVNEAMAWVYYKSGDPQAALPYLEKALRTHCQNPVMLCRAGIIYAKAGMPEKAKTCLQVALKYNPNIDPELMRECLSQCGSLIKTYSN